MARILIMEDDSFLAMELSSALSKAGHDPVVSYTGSEAFAMLSDQPFDLLVTDLIVYDGGQVTQDGGIALLGKIRSVQLGPRLAPMRGREWIEKLPILAISGTTNSPGLEHMLKATTTLGATDYLAKPFRMTSLLHRVERLLAGARGAGDTMD